MMTATALAHRPPPAPAALIQDALALVDDSGIVSAFEAWRAEDGVAAAVVSLPDRVLLTAMVALGLEGTAPSPAAVATLLGERLTPRTRLLIGLDHAFVALGCEQRRRRVRRAMARLLDVIDSQPLPSRQRLTKGEWDAVIEDRAVRADELETKRQRLVEVANRLLGAQYNTLPVDCRGDRVNVAVDSRFRRARTKGISLNRVSALADSARVSAEPDAGFFVTGPSLFANQDSGYGWEDELAVLISPDPTRPGLVPNIVVGFNTHVPGQGGARAAMEMLEHVGERTGALGFVVVDRAYTAVRRELFVRPLRALGADIVADYPTHRLGVQEVVDGAVLVEGIWYQDSMPHRLKDAVKRTRDTGGSSPAERAEARLELDALIAARGSFTLPAAERARTSTELRHEQRHPYMSEAWTNAYLAGRRAFTATHATVREQRLSGALVKGATAQAVSSLLAIVGANARIVSAFTDRSREHESMHR
nr:hypothetical protein [uncultured Microbacterium sp.]